MVDRNAYIGIVPREENGEIGGLFLVNCLEMRQKCGVKTPLKEICKNVKRCDCWSDVIGCRGITPIKKLRFSYEWKK